MNQGHTMQHKAMQRLNRFRNDASGAVAIEFVLIAPLLFALLFGIMTIGFYVGVSHSVSQLATGAARASVAGLDMEERVELAQAYLARASSNYPLLSQDAVTPDIQTETTDTPGIMVRVTYAIDGSVMDIANSLLGFNIADITGKSYLAY